MCSAAVNVASLCKQNRPKHNNIIYDTRYYKNTDGFNKTYNYIHKNTRAVGSVTCVGKQLSGEGFTSTTLPAGEFGPCGGQLPTGVGGGGSRFLPDGHRVLHAIPSPAHTPGKHLTYTNIHIVIIIIL